MTNELQQYGPDNSLPGKIAFERPRVPRRTFHETVIRALDIARDKGLYLQTLRYLGEQSLFFFCVYLLKWTYLDNDWGYALCHEVQRKKYNRIWIISREHFKSTVITIGSTIREILMDPETTIGIQSYNDEDVKALFFSPIKTQLESNPILLQLYPDVLWDDPRKADTWLSDQINVKRKVDRKEKTLQCGSIFSQFTGYHLEKIIGDDLETIESVRTAERIETLKAAVDMSFNTGQSKNPNFCYVGTYYAYHDLYEYLAGKGLFELIEQPCIDSEGRGILWDDETMRTKKLMLGSATFATQCLCDPKAGSTVGFKKEWIRTWACRVFTGLNIYVFVDPAGKVNRKRDYTVFWVIGLDSQDNFYVIDLVADKLTLTQRTETLFRIHRTYHPKQIFYEQVALQADIEHIEERQEMINYRFPIIPVNQTLEKGMRIEGLIPLFEAGRVYLPEHIVHRNWEGRDEDMIETFINDEFLAWPHVIHDDRLDDLANIVHRDVAPMLHRPDTISAEREIYEKLKAKGTADLPFDEGGDLSSLDSYIPY